ncbi:MAG: DNA ligase [Spirochaetia bacterium]|nr:DNA ligase [Spirochaetia bacterium]
MSKMNELSLLVKELNQCGETLINISESLAKILSNGDESRPTAPDTPTSKKRTITLESIRVVLADKSRAGHTAKVRELLEKHGAEKLSEIDPSKYPALLADAEVLGNG